jgi:predicted metal-binding membrane protein
LEQCLREILNTLYTLATSVNTLENILKKDRFLVLSGLFVIGLLSWLYIIYLYRQMVVMDMNALLFAMPMTPQWTWTDFVLLFLMWFVMMIAMMIPAVTPLILIFALINRQRQQQQSPFVPAGYLLSGYFLVWAGFSLVATCLQWLLQQISLLNPEMETTSKILGAIILISAGVFQFTPLKHKCLNHCRTPIHFIHSNWKEGKKGALIMGAENGMYCLGCCWILMILLFVSGIMNLLWIALIALFVLIEKVLPAAKLISFIAGVVLIGYGIVILVK